MEPFNYNHLHYFWAAAHAGSMGEAARRLHVTQPTISSQVKALEQALGTDLFARQGRRLALTEAGQTIYRYANEMFDLGGEMLRAIRGGGSARTVRLQVGLADVVPKLVAHQLLAPAFSQVEGLAMRIREGKPRDLMALLATYQLDVVITDTPLDESFRVRAYNHLLGESPIAFYAATDAADLYTNGFPGSLENAPLLLPIEGARIRSIADEWFARNKINPRVVAEFEDSALLKVFAREGMGLFPAPIVIDGELQSVHGVRRVGEIDGPGERFYAISVERRVRHPGVGAIVETARRDLFA